MTRAATFGPCLRAMLTICLRCLGGRRRQMSQAVSARVRGPAARRVRNRVGRTAPILAQGSLRVSLVAVLVLFVVTVGVAMVAVVLLSRRCDSRRRRRLDRGWHDSRPRSRNRKRGRRLVLSRSQTPAR